MFTLCLPEKSQSFQTQARYSKPILASRDAKASSKEQENGVLAMESLHRQTLPFLLRRMKEDVLKDLPPKITQDYYCELSPLQVKLYEDFSKKHAELSQSNQPSVSSPAHAHIFQVYSRNCFRKILIDFVFTLHWIRRYNIFVKSVTIQN